MTFNPMNDFEHKVNVYAYYILSWLHIKGEQGNHLTIAICTYCAQKP